ncbi:MAG: molybdopterin-binding oxidoreductase, partial [Stackebrandtia sp.]
MNIDAQSDESAVAALSRPLAALWGVTVAAVAVAAAELVAAVVSPRAAPLSSVGDVVIAVSPDSVVEWAKQTLGTADKTVLQLGTLVILAGVAAACGIAARRRIAVAWLGLGLFSIAGAAAAVTRHDAAVWAVLPSLLGGGLSAAAAVWWLPRFAAADRRSHAPDDPRLFDRRRFITTAATMIGAAGASGYLSRGFAQDAAVSLARDQITLPAPADPAFPLPEGTELDVGGLSSWRTSNEVFYRIDTALTTPSVDPKEYRLRIFGRTARELTLSYQDILDRPLRERDITMT